MSHGTPAQPGVTSWTKSPHHLPTGESCGQFPDQVGSFLPLCLGTCSSLYLEHPFLILWGPAPASVHWETFPESWGLPLHSIPASITAIFLLPLGLSVGLTLLWGWEVLGIQTSNFSFFYPCVPSAPVRQMLSEYRQKGGKKGGRRREGRGGSDEM